jgi:2-oxoglutarate ferredoxin oxidoreductase subunit alpha
MKELALMKGNEAIAEAAIRAGVDAYFGYPITPQSEVMEYRDRKKGNDFILQPRYKPDAGGDQLHCRG